MFRVFIILVTASLLAGATCAQTPLTEHDAEYKVKISVFSGKLNTSLRRTDSGYVAHHVIKTTGMSRLVSRGRMDVTSEFSSAYDGIRPISFKAVDTLRKDPPVDLRFDWGSKEAIGSVGPDEVVLQLNGIAHDSVSIQYALMHDLLNGEPDDVYTLFDVDKMRVANVSNAGNKKVRTKAGNFVAVGIRTQRAGSSRITTMWCVEELGFLPVIIEQHRKGKLNFRATLVKYAPLAEDDR